MWPPHSFLLLQSLSKFFVLLPLFASRVCCTITNTTVDDTSNAFTWTGEWTAITPSAPCGGCASKPDTTQIEDGTYHDGNFETTKDEVTGGSFTFQGSAVYIYGIDQADSQPNIVFTLDSTTSTHHYTGSERFLYRALFFSATGLDSGQHTVNWVYQPNNDIGKTLQEALFDYAVVTSGTADTAPSSGGTTTIPSTGGDSGQDPSNDSGTSAGANSNSSGASSNAGSGSDSLDGKSSSPGSCDHIPVADHGKWRECGQIILFFFIREVRNCKSKPSPDLGDVASDPDFKTDSATTNAQSSQSSAINSNGAAGSNQSNPTPNQSNPATASAARSKINVAAVAGALVGALVFGIFIAVSFSLYRRRRQRPTPAADAWLPRPRRPPPSLQPFVADTPAPEISDAESPALMPSEKTFDVAWNTPAQSTVSLLRQAPQLQSAGDRQSPIPLEEGPPVNDSLVVPSAAPTARELMLEERLAELEARVGSASAPPPYM
ncbi:hypothetical protein C8R47DRAFT_1062983 [Mycena vitilis]|nr:hypothetical protein C8R47DRAFT_1062983 [Mycena vitilis]